MGETFPEGTSQSDPTVVPPRMKDEDELIEDDRERASDDEPTAEEEPGEPADRLAGRGE